MCCLYGLSLQIIRFGFLFFLHIVLTFLETGDAQCLCISCEDELVANGSTPETEIFYIWAVRKAFSMSHHINYHS